jgi:hypothetical protein
VRYPSFGCLTGIPAVIACCGALAWAATAAYAGPPQPLKGNPADRMADRPIDDYRYDHASRCRKQPSQGALALQNWLTLHVRGSFWGIMRCERLSGRNFSLHSEGRALDWHLDVQNGADRRAARRLIRTLLAHDSAGNPHALARRMGIQEIIWDCRSWWSGSEGMDDYSVCVTPKGKRRSGVSPTLAHRDHIHLGLSRAGAALRTSYWRSR